jgi:hypothetical protein
VIARPANCAPSSFKPAAIVTFRGKYWRERPAGRCNLWPLRTAPPSNPFFGGLRTRLNCQRFTSSGTAVRFSSLPEMEGSMRGSDGPGARAPRSHGTSHGKQSAHGRSISLELDLELEL